MVRPLSPTPRADRSAVHPVVWTGLVLVVLQVVVRGVALSRGWFYADDYELLSDATGHPLTLGYLLSPHDSQLMPGGRLAVWLVSRAGTFSWGAVMAEVLAVQLLAGLACLVMLVRLFGARWWCLAPLALYLLSPVTLSGFMWWSAALNQVPCQLACFLLVTCHVEHLRTGRRVWAVLAVASLGLGLAFYVKTLILLAPLAVLSVCYLAPGGPTWSRRVVALVRRHWPVWTTYTVLAAGYLAYLSQHVPDPTRAQGAVPYAGLVANLLGTSLPTLLVGGPWHWSDLNLPLGLVDAPGWAVALSWVVLLVALALLVRRRGTDLRPFLVVAPYLAVTVVLLARSRGRQAGNLVGLEPRYLADAAPLLALVLALLLAGSRGLRPASSGGRGPAAAVPAALPGTLLLVLTTAFAVGATVSTVSYVRMWDADWAAKDFTRAVIRQSQQDPLVVADTPVPVAVIPSWTFPANLPSRVFAPLGDRLQAVTQGNDLEVLDASGAPRQAEVGNGLGTAPGPTPGCGFLLDTSGLQVPLTGPGTDPTWWAQVSYLSGSRGEVDLSLGGVRRTVEVRAGLHDYLVQGQGPVSSVRLVARSSEVHVCVDRVRVGDLRPEGGLG
ncbi:MAG: hypothetical protein JWR42_2657 [Marmoricola sp.]|nr:hypothetical protein [Marmoricola sp.]